MMIVKKYVLVASLVVILVLFDGCSAGNNTQTPQQPSLPQGPVSYQSIIYQFDVNQFNNQSRAQNNRTSLNLASGTSCGSVLGHVSQGVSAAMGFVSFIPDAGPILAVIGSTLSDGLSLISGGLGNNCTAQEFASIENQLVAQQNEINNIEANLNLASNTIWSAIDNNIAETAGLAYTNYIDSIDDISAQGGLFINAYSNAGFINTDLNNQLTSETLSQLIESTEQLNQLATELQSLSSNTYIQTIQNITATEFKSTSCPESSIVGNLPFCAPSISSNIAGTHLGNLLSAANGYLQSSLIVNINAGQNAVPLFDDYNNALTSYYQQSLYALQEIYHIAYLINYINYAQSEVTLPNILNISGLYYSRQESTAGVNYTEVQKNLTLFTAGLINQLYSNVMGFIVTDGLVGSQSYPSAQTIPYYTESGLQKSTNESINYAKLIGANIAYGTATQYLYNALEGSQFNSENQYSNLVSQIKSLGSSMYYQYTGIQNVAQIIGFLESYNVTNGMTGSVQNAFNGTALIYPILTDINDDSVDNSVFNNDTIQPYLVTGPKPKLSGNVTGNIGACSNAAVGQIPAWSMYLYTPNGTSPTLGVIGQQYLMCGNWLVNGNVPGVTGISSMPPDGTTFGTTSPNNPNYKDSYFATSLRTTNGSNQGFYISYFSSLSNFPEYSIMGYDKAAVWSEAIGDGGIVHYAALNLGEPYGAFASGWVNDNFPSGSYTQLMHVIAAQVPFNDGFIAPIVVDVGYYWSPLNVNGYTVGLGLNPYVVNAKVTIESKPLYDYSQILTNSNYYGSGFSNYNWMPVLSQNPIFQFSGANNSSVTINGNMLAFTGMTPVENQPSQVQATLCSVNPQGTLYGGGPTIATTTTSGTDNNGNSVSTITSFNAVCY